jgi:predicted PurR-regulated permease PerM
MSERKVVGRNGAIALGIICIILVAGLIVAVANYTSIIKGKDDTIASLQNQMSDLNSIINLQKSTVWVNDQTVSQPASSYTYWTVSADYAGYISVQVQTSTTTNTYVRVRWSAYGVNYDQQITVGTSGTAVFPVLPCSNIEIRVGNSNLVNGASETVTITYHY